MADDELYRDDDIGDQGSAGDWSFLAVVELYRDDDIGDQGVVDWSSWQKLNCIEMMT